MGLLRHKKSKKSKKRNKEKAEPKDEATAANDNNPIPVLTLTEPINALRASRSLSDLIDAEEVANMERRESVDQEMRRSHSTNDILDDGPGSGGSDMDSDVFVEELSLSDGSSGEGNQDNKDAISVLSVPSTFSPKTGRKQGMLASKTSSESGSERSVVNSVSEAGSAKSGDSVPFESYASNDGKKDKVQARNSVGSNASDDGKKDRDRGRHRSKHTHRKKESVSSNEEKPKKKTRRATSPFFGSKSSLNDDDEKRSCSLRRRKISSDKISQNGVSDHDQESAKSKDNISVCSSASENSDEKPHGLKRLFRSKLDVREPTVKFDESSLEKTRRASSPHAPRSKSLGVEDVEREVVRKKRHSEGVAPNEGLLKQLQRERLESNLALAADSTENVDHQDQSSSEDEG